MEPKCCGIDLYFKPWYVPSSFWNKHCTNEFCPLIKAELEKTMHIPFLASKEHFDVPNQLHQDVKDLANKYQDYTPDIVALEQKEFQPLFIYGRGMKDHPEAWFMEREGNVLCAKRAYTEDQFVLYKRALGNESYPIALSGSLADRKQSRTANVGGELWQVRSQYLFDLDLDMQNTIYFERRKVKIIVPHRVVVIDKAFGGILHQHFHIGYLEAWMYLGVDKIWEEHIDGGYQYKLCSRYAESKKLKPKEPLFDTYYYFSRMEYIE